ncbi:TPA: hypothetical protein HA318_05950 [Candidatus Micrarchaeota archaeon]|nr:hypothetical protein [Candidatus Micrarchaeota archaeon]
MKKVKVLATRVEKVTAKHQTPWLQHWTLHTIEVLEDKAKRIAQEISKVIGSKPCSSTAGYWYADFKNETRHYIIFRNKVFHIDRKSKEQYETARQYGLSLGIPEYQVDFHRFLL